MSITSVEMQDPDGWETTVREAVARLRFGSVEVVVHEGRVVQVETREKLRFAESRPPDDRRRTSGGAANADRRPGGPRASNEEIP